MEKGDSDDPEKKRQRRPLANPNSNFSLMARHSNGPSSADNPTIDAAVLQYQNQKLVQQLEIQKHELRVLEDKIKELRDKQAAYDNTLITVNQLWNHLVDDLILLGIRAGTGQSSLQALHQADHSRGCIPSCPAEDMFLCRLLEVGAIENSGRDGPIAFVKEKISMRHGSTMELMKLLEDTIEAQRAKTEAIAQALKENPSPEDAIIQLNKIDNLMKEEACLLREMVDALHIKHREYLDGIQSCTRSHSMDQSEIKQLAGDLEEAMAELEESRRKLISLKMQKDGASGIEARDSIAVNGTLSPDNPVDKTMGLRGLKDAIEETKILDSDRLSELQDAQEDNLILSQQLQDLQNEVKNDKYVYSSRAYGLLNDQLQHWTAELDRLRALTDSLQAERSFILRREKELNMRAESVESMGNAINSANSKIENLEHRLQTCISEKNDAEIKMEEALQDAARKDIKAEFQVMASSLSKELGMTESQLNRWKETASEAVSLRDEAESLKALLGKKASEEKSLKDTCAEQTLEIRQMQGLVEKKQKESLELQIFLDLLGHQIYDNRELMEIKESEQRAHSQAEVLKNDLNEHGLELRVKAAKEAETACQQRLSAAEAEIADLQAALDASDRDVLELREAIKSKDAEAESYISEIETIGQAYEDMQTQNQHLLQQVTERDDYNIKLVSESVKTKQTHSFLLSEKQALDNQLQQVRTAEESLKLGVLRWEEQMKVNVMDALKCTQEDVRNAIKLETAKWELADTEKEMKWIKSVVSSSDKEYDQIHRTMEDVRMELENERNERKKLDEELKELNLKIAEMSSGSGEAAIQKLQDEIKECKSVLKCGVCFDRPKEVVIVKCFHLFCNHCIQRNLEIRHRKCPGCGTPFGQSDVRFVKI